VPKGNGTMVERAVVLAGGKGSRLGPYTTVLPKPLLPIGDRAILDVVVRQLCNCGFGRITLAVGYLSHLVRAVMGDGSRYDIAIDYHEEEEPLGTVGALATIGDVGSSFLVMNGDVLTALDYRVLMKAHRASGNALTIATHPRVIRTDYGVLHVDDDPGPTGRVVGFEEKPEIPFMVSMGIYILEPRTLEFIEPGERLDLPDLVLRLLEAGEQVGSYLFEGFWLDIGRHEDYEQAIRDFDKVRHELLGEHASAAADTSPQ
jgi:NDP-mannose synthase